MKILVTGGAGYIGSSLVSYLIAKNNQVRVLDSLLHGGESLLGVWPSADFEFMEGDIRDPKKVGEALRDIDAVVHLAAIVGDPACARDPGAAREVNLSASLHLIEQCKRHGVGRFVFASTCSNYGKMPDPDQYLDEASELHPVSLYAETKVAVERAILDGPDSDGWCPTLLRFATIFGVSPRMRFDLTVNEFAAELLIKKRLTVFGEQFWRPYVHVRDAACAIQLVLGAEPSLVRSTVFNVGSTSQNFRKQDIVNMIRPLVPDAQIEFVHKKEDPRDYRVSFERIAQRLGFNISKTVDQGIQEVARLIQSRAISNFEDSRYRN